MTDQEFSALEAESDRIFEARRKTRLFALDMAETSALLAVWRAERALKEAREAHGQALAAMEAERKHDPEAAALEASGIALAVPLFTERNRRKALAATA